jgi:SAM-dependent methyltransferase
VTSIVVAGDWNIISGDIMIPCERTPEFWIDRWNDSFQGDTKKVSAGYQTAAFWDAMARNYDHDFDEREERKLDALASLFRNEGCVLEGARILDIGCGSGRHSCFFEALGAHVTALDFSTGMLDVLKQRIPRTSGGSLETVQDDWSAVDLDRFGWRGKFDLVVANMTPAIFDPVTFSKMMEASRGFCFYKAWVEQDRSQIQDDIWNLLADKPMDDRFNPFFFAFNLLFSRDCFPHIFFEEITREREIPLDQALNTLITFFSTVSEYDETKLRKTIIGYLQKISSNGMVREHFRGRTGSMIWNVRNSQSGGS